MQFTPDVFILPNADEFYFEAMRAAIEICNAEAKSRSTEPRRPVFKLVNDRQVIVLVSLAIIGPINSLLRSVLDFAECCITIHIDLDRNSLSTQTEGAL